MSGLELKRGTPKCFKAKQDSGGSYFCQDCGTPLFSLPDIDNQHVAVKVGALDEADDFTVQADIWMSSAPQWHSGHSDALQFDENYKRSP